MSLGFCCWSWWVINNNDSMDPFCLVLTFHIVVAGAEGISLILNAFKSQDLRQKHFILSLSHLNKMCWDAGQDQSKRFLFYSPNSKWLRVLKLKCGIWLNSNSIYLRRYSNLFWPRSGLLLCSLSCRQSTTAALNFRPCFLGGGRKRTGWAVGLLADWQGDEEGGAREREGETERSL